MEFYVGNTDWHWFSYLRSLRPVPEDIDFWKPSEVRFGAVPIGAPFLFRLKAPRNAIAGLGFFAGYARFPLSVTWETFSDRTGCESLSGLTTRISEYRAKNGIPNDFDALVGCIALTDPIFFDDEDFIPSPSDWSGPIVSGKTYSSKTAIGGELWGAVEAMLSKYRRRDPGTSKLAPEAMQEAQWLGYSGETRQKVRIGQGAFRLMVTNAYTGRCAVTGESVINVLEAAHIRDYAQEGPNLVCNGLLLRADLHKLLDAGLMTVTTSHHVEIARTARGYEVETSLYNSLHGKSLAHLPARIQDHPHQQYLSWHNQNRYKG